ncbi:Lrp/AsnC family transcriptional regulator [Marinilactibacillus kalidii]|uniref:Lrp/AsnC family transcriptional regulator n=1 Tax=Marinilactibacillus kalidii TaxID=2820274 RepID=UPI001ABEB172|nr:Lrp/AsnC family transcriptional regulator [Marinilactibacillus kalidii]
MIDATDELILKELQQHGRITMKALGEKVHLSGQATADRVIRLEESGVIEGYTTTVKLEKNQMSIKAFITLIIKATSHEPLLKFIEEERGCVKKAYRISGEGCYLVEGEFSSSDVMDEFLVKLNHYASYKVSIVIKDILL